MKWIIRFVFSLSMVLLVYYSCTTIASDNRSSQVVYESPPALIEEVETIDSSAYYDSIYAPLKTDIERYFKRRYRAGAFNGTYLVAEKGRVIAKGAHGFSDFRRWTRLSDSSSFQLASVSKPFTAVAIMMLKEQGKVDYDENVKKYIPEFPYEGITIRMLLTHRSGLGNYTYFSDQLWHNQLEPISNDDVIQLMVDHKPMTYYDPDKTFDYSNTGYVMLASIIERVTDKTFEEFMKENIFAPLEMKNTTIYNKTKEKNIINEAIGYAAYRRRAIDIYLNGVVGDKGVYSTVEDLLKFDQALYDNKLLTQETLKEAYEPSDARKAKRKEANYGFGWRIINYDSDDKIVYHGGWWRGFRSCFIRCLKTKRTIIVLDNVKRGFFPGTEELLSLFPPSKSS